MKYLNSFACFIFIFVVSATMPHAQPISSQSILDSLTGPTLATGENLSRGFQPKANPDAATKVCDPQLNVQLIEKTGATGEQLTRNLYVESVPKIDLDISFKKGDAALLPEGVKQLDLLATALNDPKLIGQSFVVAGHTDAEGGLDYNNRLSCERALSARRYLQEKHGMDKNLLIPMGFGFSKLKDPSNKFNPINRRVEIRKYAATTTN